MFLFLFLFLFLSPCLSQAADHTSWYFNYDQAAVADFEQEFRQTGPGQPIESTPIGVYGMPEFMQQNYMAEAGILIHTGNEKVGILATIVSACLLLAVIGFAYWIFTDVMG